MAFLRSFRSHAAWERCRAWKGLRTSADHKKRVVMLGRGEPVGTLNTAQREDNEVSCEGESRHFQEDLLPLQEAGGGRLRIKGRFNGEINGADVCMR